MRYWLKVGGIDARSVAAQVVEVEVRWYRSDEQFVDSAMRATLVASDSDRAIAGRRTAGVQPASVAFNDTSA